MVKDPETFRADPGSEIKQMRIIKDTPLIIYGSNPQYFSTTMAQRYKTALNVLQFIFEKDPQLCWDTVVDDALGMKKGTFLPGTVDLATALKGYVVTEFK
jgi:hypothetical protein